MNNKCVICNSDKKLRHKVTVHIDDVRGEPSPLCEICFKLLKSEDATLRFSGARIMELHRQATARRGAIKANEIINNKYSKKEISDMKRRAVNTRYKDKEKGRGGGKS